MDSNFSPSEDRVWTFVTNHFFVLLCVARNPDLRIRDIANLVGITERATQMMLSDLVQAGYLDRTRVGRRNHYRVRWTAHFRHPLLRSSRLGDVLEALEPAQMLTAASRPDTSRAADSLAPASRNAAAVNAARLPLSPEPR